MAADDAQNKAKRASPSQGPGGLGLLLALLPKIPFMIKVAIWHLLSLSPESKHQDFQTEFVVKLIGSFLVPSKPRPISATQKLLGRDPGVKGRVWISTYAAPIPPEASIREALEKAIKGLDTTGSAAEALVLPEIIPVEAEWTGYRPGVAKDALPPRLSEKEKYAALMNDVKMPATVLYFHGGAYYAMDPATHRATTKRLAKLTGGRCYSVRYRLAPQNPFPAALLDALVSYLTLLYPPPDAFHEAVQPQHVVFAGDSAGGNLALVLLQTVLELRRQNIKIVWHGEERDIPLPAGITLSSPWTDITHSSPSCETMLPWDYLPGRRVFTMNVPRCDAWPASPPRVTLYSPDAFVAHPLVAPVLARSWESAPPLYICTGWEMLADEGKFVATQFHADGTAVVHEEYEGMPHCFALIFANAPASRRCFQGWSEFIKQVVKDPDSVETRFTVLKAKTLKEEQVEAADARPYMLDEIDTKIRGWIAGRLNEVAETAASAKL
ncbi:hypothetical protein GQ53DRAFT_760234 [Thozetella sp. PMI_491]|nr:hypothetical protein GQ53DRAFT_760234 [Thozetella sp. PMI_491]